MFFFVLEGLDKEPVYPLVFFLAEKWYADGHLFVARLGLGSVGAAEVVPPGEVEAEIAVGLGLDDGVVDAVHVGRDEKTAE